jgi:L-threonylcarbamoyladenylate synthase
MNNLIKQAINSFAQGKLVAIPTETVYGLAAPIDKPELITRIFSIKERPFFDPLIIHVDGIAMAKKWVAHWPESAQLLAEKFWPGPLSIILPKAASVDERITSGLTTVAVRCPHHALTLALIEQMGVPLAAPSANKFGKTSPTTAAHVAQEFSSEDVLVLDGGACEVGIESTIVKIENNSAIIMRQGMITPEQIKQALAPMNFAVELYNKQTIEAPGQVKHHYMPKIPVVEIPSWPLSQWHTEIVRRLGVNGAGRELDLGPDPAMAARQLYSNLRILAESGAAYIAWVQPQNINLDQTPWASILDRLKRASLLTIS